MEVRGVEPRSEMANRQASTCLATLLNLTQGFAGWPTTLRQIVLISQGEHDHITCAIRLLMAL